METMWPNSAPSSPPYASPSTVTESFCEKLPICPEPDMPQMPAIFPVLASQVGEMIVVKIFRENPIAGIFANSPPYCAVPSAKSPVPPPATSNATLSLGGTFSDDVDDAVHCVCAPYRRTWTANDLNPVDVLEGNVLSIPIDAGEKRRIDGPPVDQHQQFVGKLMVKASR